MVDDYRSGFIALTGRPNVGKSSLVNAFVDANVAITSNKPETTRKAIRAILTLEDAQLIFVDTPGLHKPKTTLGKRLNTIVDEQLTNVDLILFLTPADQKIGKGDLFILSHLQKICSKRIKLFCIVTKTDKVQPKILMEKLQTLNDEEIFEHIIPVSAKTMDNVEYLISQIVKYLPKGDMLYDENQITDQTKFEMIEEVVRQQALEKLNDELPHSLVVKTTEIVGREVYISLYVERSSQKGIIIGHQGENIRNIRLSATKIINSMVDGTVHLNLSVKVAKNWQSDPKLLNKLGF